MNDQTMNDQTMTPTTDDTTDPARRRRKLLALGAGGLVLGIGAVVTMAAWTDTEEANADFGSGSFGIQGSADGTTFSDNPTTPGLTVDFGSIATDYLSPGDTVTADYALRLDPSSDYSADIVLSGSTGTGAIAEDLTYTVEQMSGPGEGATVVSTLVSDADATVAQSTDTLFSLDALDEPVYLRFEVTAGDSLSQGATGDVAWTFTGTSVAPLS